MCPYSFYINYTFIIFFFLNPAVISIQQILFIGI